MNKWFRRLLISCVTGVILLAFGLYRLNELNAKPIEVSQFSWVNKVEIYALGALMSLAAWPIYPEVAREHMMLYAPFDEDPKIIKDDFFLQSVVVQQAIKKAANTKKSHRLAWPASAYRLSFDRKKYQEARIALALNGAYLSVQDNQIAVRIKIAYPRKYLAPLVAVPGLGVISVEEGLFWILQQEGWYHTGHVEYVAERPL
jgi:hypothetical protein